MTAALERGVDHGDGEYRGYLATVRRRLQEALQYPSAARRRGLSGTVHVDVLIRSDGSIGEVTLVSSSSHAVLDAAAVDAFRRLSAVPFPPGLPRRAFRARVPVVFDLD